MNIIRRENTESQETKIAVLCPIQFCVLCTILLIANDTFSLIAVGAAETFSIKSGGGGLPPDRALARCRTGRWRAAAFRRRKGGPALLVLCCAVRASAPRRSRVPAARASEVEDACSEREDDDGEEEDELVAE